MIEFDDLAPQGQESPSAPPGPFNFLGLHRELRDLVYEHFINTPQETLLEAGEGDMASSRTMFHTLRNSRHDWAPMLVNKQVHEEYEAAVFRETRHLFKRDLNADVHNFVRIPEMHQFSLLRHLEVNITIKCREDMETWRVPTPRPAFEEALWMGCPSLRTVRVALLYEAFELVEPLVIEDVLNTPYADYAPPRESSILRFTVAFQVRLPRVFIDFYAKTLVRRRVEAEFEKVAESVPKDPDFVYAVHRAFWDMVVESTIGMEELISPLTYTEERVSDLMLGVRRPKLTVEGHREQLVWAQMLYQEWIGVGKPFGPFTHGFPYGDSQSMHFII